MGMFDDFGKAWSTFGHSFWDQSAATYDLVTSAAFGNDNDKRNALSAWALVNKQYGGDGSGTVGNMLNTWKADIGTGANAAVSSVPYGKDLTNALYTANTYAVSRPLSTWILGAQHDDVDTSNMSFGDTVQRHLGDLTTLDHWRQAWDLSERISPGQALWGEVGPAQQGVTRPSMDQIANYVDNQNRDNGSKQDTWFKYTTGATDFSTTFLDPLIIAGKAGKLAKLSYLKPLRSAADVEGYLTSTRFAKFDKATDALAHDPQAIHQQFFWNSPMGAQKAHLMSSLQGDTYAKGLAIRSMAGDLDAFSDLAARNAAAADLILSKRSAEQAAALMEKRGIELSEEDQGFLSALTDSATDAMQQRAKISADQLDQLYGSMNGIAGPRVSTLNNLRATVRQNSIYDRPLIMRPAYAAMRGMSSDNRIVHRINLNAPDSATALRQYLERSPVARETKNDLVNQYMAASQPEQRALIAAKAQDAALEAVGNSHGLSRESVDRLLAEAADQRTKAARMMSAARVYQTDGVKAKFVDAMEDAAGPEGKASALTWLDENGDGNVAPLLETQTADFVPMIDLNSVDSILKRESQSGPFARGRARTWELSDEVLASANAAWKFTTLMRLGWPIRAVSDETARRAALWGVGNWLAANMHSLVRMDANLADRALIAGSTLFARNPAERAAMAASAQEAYEAGKAGRTASEASALPLSDGAGAAPMGGKFGSLEEALAAGALSTEQYADAVKTLGIARQAPEVEHALVENVGQGALSEDDYRRAVVEHALGKLERDAYTQPWWQRGILTRAEKGALSVNPFDGEISKLNPKRVTEVVSKDIPLRDAGSAHVDDLYDFTHENLDELLTPGNRLAVTHSKDGVHLAVVRDGAAPVVDITGTPITGQRIRDLKVGFKKFGEMKRTAYNEGFTHKGVYGDVEVSAPFAENQYQGLVSAKGAFSSLYRKQALVQEDRLLASRGYSEIHSTDKMSYRTAYPNVVNNQIGQSEIARRILAGGPDADPESIAQWLQESGPQGGKHIADRMPHRASDPYAWAQNVKAMVDEYVPDVTWTEHKFGEPIEVSLRQKALDGTITVQDLEKALPNKAEWPVVHGEKVSFELGDGELVNMLRKTREKLYHVFGDLPADKLSRYPVFAQRYRDHFKAIYSTAEQFKGDMLDTADIARAERAARRNALHDVTKWMMNTESTTAFASKMRYITPFAAAAQDSLSAWTKIAAIERPESVGLLWRAWSAPDRNGLVTDNNGNQLRIENGREVWYAPQEGGQLHKVTDPSLLGEDRYVNFKLAEGQHPDLFNGVAQLAGKINKQGFNTILQTNIGAGPIVQVPMNAFIKANPSFDAGKDKPGAYNWFLKQVMPYGVTSDNFAAGQSSAIREAYALWQGDNNATFNGRMMAIYQSDMVAYAQGLTKTKPTLAQAADKAKTMGIMRLLGAVVLPVNPQWVSPYQPYIDAYKQLKATDPVNADAKWYDQHGEEFMWLANRTTKAVAGVPPTQGGYASYEKHKALIDQHPDLAGLIVGADGAGEFSKAVYEWQKSQSMGPGSGETMRELLTPQQQVDDMAERKGWVAYGKFMDYVKVELTNRGLASINAPGAEDIKAARSAFVKATGDPTSKFYNAQWYQAFNTVDNTKQARKLDGMYHIVQDPALMGRDDIRGLADYLILRQQMVSLLSQRAALGGSKSLEAQDNSDLAQMWDNAVGRLTESNVAFASLHNRWLTHDQLAADQVTG